jgi:hypothetical protein
MLLSSITLLFFYVYHPIPAIMDGEEVGSYPVLIGVSPDTDPDPDMASFQHVESVDTAEDCVEATNESQEPDDSNHQPYAIAPVVAPYPRQQHRHDNCSHSTLH